MTERRFNDIEDYLDGTPGKSLADLTEGLDAGEVAVLEGQIKAARELRLAVGATELRDSLRRLHAERGGGDQASPSSPVVVRNSPVKAALIIAGLLLLALFGYYLLRPAPPAVYAEYAYQDPGLPVVMGPEDDRAFSEGMLLFQRGDYPGALEAFDALPGPASDTVTYYRAASAYYAGVGEAPLEGLQAVAEDETSLFRERAEYLLALRYLELGREAAGRGVLEEIVNTPGHAFREMAGRVWGEAFGD